MDLTGKVALVTGAGQGIGKEIALELSKHGAELVIADLNFKSAGNVVKEIVGEGRKAIPYQIDVSNEMNVSDMINEIVDQLGSIDILVNNAGIAMDRMMHRMTSEEFSKVLDVNMNGTFYCMKEVALHMRHQKSGKIINISSILGKVGNIGQVNYAGAKAGIVGMTKSAAKELAGHNVFVNAVQPGFIETDLTRELPEEIKNEKLKEIPLNKIGSANDVAKVVVFLSSSYSNYMTGNVLEVGGGRYM